jgi:serine/threonine-protein kinase
MASGRVRVPSVTGLAAQDAFEQLRQAGFAIRITRRGSDRVAPGQAIGTNPGAGSLLPPGGSLELFISQGR